MYKDLIFCFFSGNGVDLDIFKDLDESYIAKLIDKVGHQARLHRNLVQLRSSQVVQVENLIDQGPSNVDVDPSDVRHPNEHLENSDQEEEHPIQPDSNQLNRVQPNAEGAPSINPGPAPQGGAILRQIPADDDLYTHYPNVRSQF